MLDQGELFNKTSTFFVSTGQRDLVLVAPYHLPSVPSPLSTTYLESLCL